MAERRVVDGTASTRRFYRLALEFETNQLGESFFYT
jgi:hypothetical protein